MKTTCEQCGKRIDENADTTSWAEDGRAFCRKCTDEMTGECFACGQHFPFWEMTCTSQDETYCGNCAVAIG